MRRKAVRFLFIVLLIPSLFVSCRTLRREASGSASQDQVKQTIDTARQVSETADDFIPWGGLITGLLGLAGTGWGTYRASRNKGAARVLSEAVEEAKKQAGEDGQIDRQMLVDTIKEVSRKRGYKVDIDKIYDSIKRVS